MIKDNIKFIVTFDFESYNGEGCKTFATFKNDAALGGWINDMEMMDWGWEVCGEMGNISNIQIWDVRANRTLAHRYDLP